MHRIDGDGHLNNTFAVPVPGVVEPTTVTADWLNATQEEIAAVIESQGIALDKLDNGQLLAALTILQAGGSSFRNRLINAEFKIDQRQEGGNHSVVSGSPKWTLDRWYANSGGGSGAATIARDDANVPTIAQADPGSAVPISRAILDWQQTTLATTTPAYLEQRVEHGFGADRTMTLTFWARVSGASPVGDLLVTPRMGTDGFIPDDSGVDGSAFSIPDDGVWRRYSVTLTLPAFSATLHAQAWTYARLSFPLSKTFTFRIAYPQFELGPTATPYESRPPALELQLARRYYEKSYPTHVDGFDAGVVPGSPGAAGSAVAWTGGGTSVQALATRLLVSKPRPLGAVTWYNPVDGTIDEIDWSGSRTVSSTAEDSPESTGHPVVTTAPGADALARGHWTYDAELGT